MKKWPNRGILKSRDPAPFTAGLQAKSWQICLLGLVVALGIPAIAWIENTALIALAVFAGILSITLVIWWHWTRKRIE